MRSSTLLSSYARHLAVSRGDVIAAAANAEALHAPPMVGAALKSAIGPGSLDGNPAIATMTAEFLDETRPKSALLRLAGTMHSAPLNVATAVNVADASAAVIAEGAPTPVSQIEFAAGRLEPRKAQALVVASDELLRSTTGAGRRLIDQSLQAGVAAALDRELASVAKAGVTPVAATGTTAAHALRDLRAALGRAALRPGSAPAWLMSPAMAERLATLGTPDGALVFGGMTPVAGSLVGMPAFTVAGVADDELVLVDAQAFAADIGAIEIDIADAASVEMNSAPTNPPVAATVTVSLWQMNMVGIRATCTFGLERVRPGGVAVVSGAAWSA